MPKIARYNERDIKNFKSKLQIMRSRIVANFQRFQNREDVNCSKFDPGYLFAGVQISQKANFMKTTTQIGHGLHKKDSQSSKAQSRPEKTNSNNFVSSEFQDYRGIMIWHV
jgi:hypothetical protein